MRALEATRERFRAAVSVLTILRAISEDTPPRSTYAGRVVVDDDLAEDLFVASSRLATALANPHAAQKDPIRERTARDVSGLAEVLGAMVTDDPTLASWTRIQARATLLGDSLAWLDEWDEEAFLLVYFWSSHEREA